MRQPRQVIFVSRNGARLVIQHDGGYGFDYIPEPLIRLLIGLIYAVPATVAGYQPMLRTRRHRRARRKLAARLRRRWLCCCWPDCFRALAPNAESPARRTGRGSRGASAYSPFFLRLRDQIRV